MSGTERLIALCRAYADAEGIELKTVSSRVFQDSKKLDALIGGYDISVRRYEAALRWFSENWPAGAPWPDNETRPQVEAA